MSWVARRRGKPERRTGSSARRRRRARDGIAGPPSAGGAVPGCVGLGLLHSVVRVNYARADVRRSGPVPEMSPRVFVAGSNPLSALWIIAADPGLTRQTSRLHGPRQGGRDRASSSFSSSCWWLPLSWGGVRQWAGLALGPDPGSSVAGSERWGRDRLGRPQGDGKPRGECRTDRGRPSRTADAVAGPVAPMPSIRRGSRVCRSTMRPIVAPSPGRQSKSRHRRSSAITSISAVGRVSLHRRPTRSRGTGATSRSRNRPPSDPRRHAGQRDRSPLHPRSSDRDRAAPAILDSLAALMPSSPAAVRVLPRRPRRPRRRFHRRRSRCRQTAAMTGRSWTARCRPWA